MENKNIGKIFEGRWKVVEYVNPKYILENIYNGKRIEIWKSTFHKIECGQTTISKILCYRVNKANKNNPKCIKQVTIKAAQKTMYAIRKERGTLND